MPKKIEFTRDEFCRCENCLYFDDDKCKRYPPVMVNFETEDLYYDGDQPDLSEVIPND